MRRPSRVLASIAVALALGAAAHAQQGVPARVDVWARAPRAITLADLGATYDDAFEQVSSGMGAARAHCARRHETFARTLSGAAELRANAALWSTAPRGDLAHLRVLLYRSLEIECLHEQLEPGAPPASARWLLSGIAVGRMLEVRQLGGLFDLRELLPRMLRASEAQPIWIDVLGLERTPDATDTFALPASFDDVAERLGRRAPIQIKRAM